MKKPATEPHSVLSFLPLLSFPRRRESRGKVPAGIQRKITVVDRIIRLGRSGMTYKHGSIFGSITKNKG
jgi:hypothetical protein